MLKVTIKEIIHIKVEKPNTEEWGEKKPRSVSSSNVETENLAKEIPMPKYYPPPP